MKKRAFTLAETLITLTIIGVVAAMTIPTLMSKYQEHQFHTAWKANYAILHNAFKMVMAEDSSMIISDCNNELIAKDFYDAMISKLAVVETCGLSTGEFDSNICDNSPETNQNRIKYKWAGINKIYSRYTTLAGGSLNAYNFCDRAALLKNGAAIYFGQSHGGMHIVVDVNNWNKGPNVLGKDVYTINIWPHNNRSWDTLVGNPHTIANMNFAPHGAPSAYCGTEFTWCAENNYGVHGCSKDIGRAKADYLYQASGSGCSSKYLYE